MKLKFLSLLGVVLAMCASSLFAAEPYRELIQAMRERYFFDYALIYIEELKSRDDVPPEIRAVLPYEEYLVHLNSVRSANTADQKEEALEKALAALDRFVEASPDHPLAAEANSARAGIYLDRAKALIWARRSENDVRLKAEQQKEALEWIAKARDVYSKAKSQFEEAYNVYRGRFLDEDRDAEEYKKRAQVEQDFIISQINVARCTYQEARVYDEGSEKHQALLQTASEMFETIHTKYRSQGAGLYARIMMGKCFEEMGELGRALGIYNEMLEHPGTSNTMQLMKAQTFFFKLIVLNKPGKKDHKLVVSEATIWLKNNPKLAQRPEGIGVQWERARALEILGGLPDSTQEEKETYLQQAYNDAQEISIFTGEFRDQATAMVQRLEPLVKGKGGDPEDFGVAFSIARNKTLQFKEFSQKIESAPSPEQKKAVRAEYELHLNETERIIRLGLSLVDEDSKPADVGAMQYFFAVTLYYSGHPYDAAAVADYIVRTATEDQAKAAQDSAFLGLAALQRIFIAGDKNNRDDERKMMADAAELLASRWPDSTKADDAHMILGDVYRTSGEPLKAAEYFSKINETYERYAEALLKSGQMYWVAYLSALREDEEDRPDKATLDGWIAKSIAQINDGMKRVESGLSKEGTPPEIYTAAKVSLAEVLISQGKEKEALALLLEGDHSVVKHIGVDDETMRPDQGPQSRPFAIQAYQLILRGYMGTEEIDKAIATMSDLERVAGSNDPEALTQIYIELGVKLRDEIERLRAEQNQERLDSVIGAFDRFLDALFNRQEGLNYNTLLWIAESYSSLGIGMKGDTAAATKYFERSSMAYDRILSQAEGNPSFMEARFVPGIQTRIAVLKRRQGDYEGALKIVTEVLEGDSKRLEAQFEAGMIYKEWAEVTNEPDKYLDATMGNKRTENKESPVYGFSQLAVLYQRIWDNPASPLADADQRFFDTMYEVADCQYQYASAQSDNDTANKYFDAAKATVQTFALYSAGDANKETWDSFDELYQQVLRAQGLEVVELERPKKVDSAQTQLPTKNTANRPERPQEKKIDPGVRDDPNYMMAIIGVLVALGLAAGMFFLLKPKKGRRRTRPGVSEAPASISLPPAEGAPVKQKTVKKKSVADMTPEEKKAVQRKMMAQKKAKQAAQQKAAAQAKGSSSKPPQT